MKIRHSFAIEPLVYHLQSGQRDILEALEEVDPDWRNTPAAKAAVPTLISNLNEARQSFSTWSENIAWTLAQIGDPRAVPPLCQFIKEVRFIPNVYGVASHLVNFGIEEHPEIKEALIVTRRRIPTDGGSNEDAFMRNLVDSVIPDWDKDDR